MDYGYYFSNKFINPVCDLLDPLVDNPKVDIFGDMIPSKPTAATVVIPEDIKCIEDVQNCTGVALYAFCKLKGVKSTGTKPVLIDRVWEFLQGKEVPMSAKGPTVVSNLETLDDLDKCTIASLSKYCKLHGLKCSGNKSTLKERVTEHMTQ